MWIILVFTSTWNKVLEFWDLSENDAIKILGRIEYFWAGLSKDQSDRIRFDAIQMRMFELDIELGQMKGKVVCQPAGKPGECRPVPNFRKVFQWIEDIELEQRVVSQFYAAASGYQQSGVTKQNWFSWAMMNFRIFMWRSIQKKSRVFYTTFFHDLWTHPIVYRIICFISKSAIMNVNFILTW